MTQLGLPSRRTSERKSTLSAIRATPTAQAASRGHINVAESLTLTLFAALLGIIGGLIWIGPALNAPRQTSATYQEFNIEQIERTAYRNAARSFDDHYQRHIGVLDVLRYYPEP
jgi:hypothetical protein